MFFLNLRVPVKPVKHFHFYFSLDFSDCVTLNYFLAGLDCTAQPTNVKLEATCHAQELQCMWTKLEKLNIQEDIAILERWVLTECVPIEQTIKDKGLYDRNEISSKCMKIAGSAILKGFPS